MSNCRYIWPLDSTEESNNTIIGKNTIRVLDCSNNVNNNELCNLWNFTHCPSDTDYCQPFVKGDIIYKQFFNPRGYFSYSFIHIIDVSTGLEIVTSENPLTIEQGYDKNDNRFTNLIIDTSKLENIECFYFHIKAFTCKFKEPTEITAFNTCVSNLVESGKTTVEAQEICLTNICSESIVNVYSEPYCKVVCQNTILVEGFYPNYDCNGNFYGKFTSGSTTNSFKPQIRLMGSIEPNQFDIEETLTNRKRISARRIETFQFRTKRIPYYVAQQLSNIFAGKTVTVDGTEYLRAINITKNNDEGTMWIVNSTLIQECDEINFTCDN